jgi:glycerol-3-phosphate acyltransferase PlsY
MFFLLLILSFLLGSIPVGFLVGKLNGIDLRKSGSGNIGATNALRTMGKKAGVITLVGDLLKGVFAVCLASLLSEAQLTQAPVTADAAFGLLAILGHCFSPFLKLKGGKGVATSLGVFLVLNPLGALIAIAVFVLAVKLSKYVSIGSISAAIVLSAQTLVSEDFQWSSALVVTTLLTSLLVISRHSANISRLLCGEEKAYNYQRSTK